MARPSFVVIRDGWPALDIGRMRHQVTIQKLGPVAPPVYDEAGPQQQWLPIVTGAMAAIDTVRGSDVVKSGQETTQLYLTVGIWFQDGITPDMRVLSDNGAVYVVQSIENILEMNVVLILNCVGLGANAA
jgi:head-tail adaptor